MGWQGKPMSETCSTVDEVELLRGALWSVYRELGFDTDGDDHYHGSSRDLVTLAVRAAREHRIASEAEYDALHEAFTLFRRYTAGVPDRPHRDVIADMLRFHGIPNP